MRPPRQLLSLSFALLFIFSLIEAFPALAQATAPAQGSSASPAAAAQANSLPKEWLDAIRSLARKIKEAMGGARVLTLDFKNISAVSDARAAAVQGALKEELWREHLELAETPPEGAATVRVTLSENEAERIWTAEIEQAGERRVAIVSVERSLAPEPRLAPAPVLQRKVVFQQTAPILDFEIEEALPNSDAKLEFRDILTPAGLIRFQFQGNKLQTELADFGPVHLAARNSRDLRGRILRSGSQDIRFFIGGSLCVAGPVADCNENSALGWPINPSGTNWGSVYDASRNYFMAGGISSGEVKAELPAFYSAVVFSFPQGTGFLLAGLDGKAEMFISAAATATYAGWGDDIVSLGQGCDGRQQALVTGTGDWTQPDYLQLYELDADRATAVGQRLQVSGPITALWPAEDGKSARVVSRDLATRMYEASVVTVVCDN